MLKFQINKFKKIYPDKKLNIYFLDDRKDILENLKKNLLCKLPENVNLNLYHYDWYGYVVENKI